MTQNKYAIFFSLSEIKKGGFMTRTIKMFSLIIMTSFVYLIHADDENLITNNKTAYILVKNVTNNYLQYTYEKGASANTCSVNGQTICRILSTLVEKTRLFNNPKRDDLKILSRDLSAAFRSFDFSGSATDRKIFVQSLINVLQAVLPLLEGRDAAECRLLIQEVSKTI
jgi:hypothetical protein